MSDRVNIVQLARYGDIINMLPAAWHHHQQGREVCWYAQRHFAPILDACSYVKPIIFEGTHDHVKGAVDLALAAGGEVLATQIDGNTVVPPIEMDNFIVSSWARAGCPELFHELPLVFDQRDAAKEAELLKAIKFDGRSVLGYSLNGHSSPYPHARQMEQWLRSRFGEKYQLLNLGILQADKIHHMLAVLEKCAAAVLIDSALLHLSYATKTPVIALVNDRCWYASEPRTHWIGKYTYSQSLTDAAKSEVGALLDTGNFTATGLFIRTPEQMKARKIVHVVDWFAGNSPTEKERIARAEKTWKNAEDFDGCHSRGIPDFRKSYWQTVRHELATTGMAYDQINRRTSKELGDTRRLPYLKDIIELAYSKADEHDIIVFTNSDISLCVDASRAIRDVMGEMDACYSRRVDMNGHLPTQSRSDLAKASGSSGCDLFAFNRKWWEGHREAFPDLLYACEGWDFVLRKMIDRSGGRAMTPPIIYHEIHQAFWSNPANLKTNPGQVYNRKLCTEWAKANGFEEYLAEGTYLFKADGAPASYRVATAKDGAVNRRGSRYEAAVRKYFSEHHPVRILETGTHLGNGSTAILYDAAKNAGIEPEIMTIECSAELAKRASKNLGARAEVFPGLSIPRAMLPIFDEVKTDFVDKPMGAIWVDHTEDYRATEYIRETSHEGPDDQIGHILSAWGGNVDFVVLDSGGHVGFQEFNYAISLIQSPCAILLDDTQHVKHYRSAQVIRKDSRFKVLVDSDEKFGFMLAEFTPERVNNERAKMAILGGGWPTIKEAEPKLCGLAIATLGFCRPQYTKQTLAALKLALDLAGVTVPISMGINPDPQRRHEHVARVARESGLAIDIRMHPTNIGCNGNAFATMEMALERPGTQYVLFLDDDILLAPDAILYHLWAMKRYAHDPRILSVGSWRHADGWLPRPVPGATSGFDGKRAMREGEMHEAHEQNFFSVWGWGIWRDRWKNVIRDRWTEHDDHKLSWDYRFDHVRKERGLLEIVPMISRAQHIGEVDGTHACATILDFWAASATPADFVDASPEPVGIW